MSYDQWKTASPYDDEPDVIVEAEKFLKEFDQPIAEGTAHRDILWAHTIIQYLLDTLEEEGIV